MFQTKGRVALLALLAWLSIAVTLEASVERVKSELKGTPWIPIHQKSSIKFKPENWKGPDDLSFQYKIAVRNGVIYVWVDVIDDAVILKKSDTIVSDHIEIWVADSGLVREYARQMNEVKKEIDELKAWLNDEEGSEKEALKAFLLEAERILQQYKNNKYYTQLVFNDSYLSALPQKNAEIRNQIFFAYQTKSRGYEFFGSIPLHGLCDVKQETIEELAYLIDVVDIDTSSADRQKTLASSSKMRVYADPSTFNTLKLSKAYTLPISSWEKLKRTLDATGYFKFVNNQYEYWAVGSPIVGERAGYVVDNFYQPLKLKDLSNSSGIQIVPHQRKLALVQKDKRVILDLEEIGGASDYAYEMLSHTIKNDKRYIVLRVRGASRPTAPSSYCGAGEEENLIWIKLDHNLEREDIQSVLIGSCFDSTEGDLDVSGDGTIKATYTSYRHRTESDLLYDPNRPEAGFSIKTTPLKEEK